MSLNLVAILSENYIGEAHEISKTENLKICFRYTGRKEIALRRDGKFDRREKSQIVCKRRQVFYTYSCETVKKRQR